MHKEIQPKKKRKKEEPKKSSRLFCVGSAETNVINVLLNICYESAFRLKNRAISLASSYACIHIYERPVIKPQQVKWIASKLLSLVIYGTFLILAEQRIQTNVTNVTPEREFQRNKHDMPFLIYISRSVTLVNIHYSFKILIW